MAYDFERVRKEFEERFGNFYADDDGGGIVWNERLGQDEALRSALLTFLEQATKEAYEQGWKDAEAQDDALLKRIGEIL